MRIGTQVAWFSWPGAPATIGPTVARIARGADEAGMSSLWFMDHFWQIEPAGPPELEMLEAYSTLSYAAALTSRIDLGVLVTGVTYRHPGILAKTVTTLDVLSAGRARLGIGAAWHEEEHLGLGIPFPRTPERFERLEETLRICRQMFDGDDTAFHGKHYRLERPLNSPQPLHRIPILIGGGGERKTLRLVASHADACNIFDMTVVKVRAKYDVMDRHCEDIGRDPTEISRTVLSRLTLSHDGRIGPDGSRTKTVDEALQHLGHLAEIGTDEVIISMTNADRAPWDLVADLVRQAESLPDPRVRSSRARNVDS